MTGVCWARTAEDFLPLFLAVEVTGGGGAAAADDFLPLLAVVDVDGGGAEAVEDFLPFFFGSAGCGGVGGDTVGGGGAAAADFLGLPIVCNTN